MTVLSFEEARTAREQAAISTPPILKDGDGGGTSGGMGTDLEKRVSTLEGDHRTLLIAFGAAFVILIGAFGGGYLALSTQMSSGFDRLGSKLDVISSDAAATKTHVAVLDERSKN